MSWLDKFLIIFIFIQIIFYINKVIDSNNNLEKRIIFIENVLNTDHQDLEYMYKPLE